MTENTKQPAGLALLTMALRNRKTGVMLVFGFASGLPFSLLLGTLNAWLADARVDLATIGILSWMGLAYAFKFLWSPLVDRLPLPGLERLGRRRSWILLCQLMIVAAFFLLAATSPVAAIGTFALVAVLAAFASATQDVAIDAWRIDVADEVATVGILSSIWQIGYRIAALVGGALALVLASRINWPAVYTIMGCLMLVAMAVTFLAPDTPRPEAITGEGAQDAAMADPRTRLIALSVVGLGWAWAIWTIGDFMVRALVTPAGAPGAPNVLDFTRYVGPWIIIATIVVPTIVAAVANALKARRPITSRGDAQAGSMLVRHGYAALVLPLSDLTSRLGWGMIVVLGLILSYRLCDSIWGPFAYPFYLDALHYSKDEVAFASKIFGVGMTIAGISLGGVMFVTLGRMPTLMVGAILAALTNLLYADLASGAVWIDGFARLTGLAMLVPDARILRLLIAISGENIAGGLAGAAFVAYLSAITSRTYSAVQYALLSSMTLLLGSLGRAALGDAIKTQGYAPVFVFTAALGLIAVFFVLAEWARERLAARRERRQAEVVA